MKRMVLLFGITLLIMFAVFTVQSYSSAMIENEAFLISSNPDNIIYLDTEDSVSLTQGDEYPAALTIGNNFANEISYELETKNNNFSLCPAKGKLSRGETTEISLEADSTIPPGESVPDVVLYAKFEGGEATLQTSFQVKVEEIEGDVNKEIGPASNKENDDKNNEAKDEKDNGEENSGNNDNDNDNGNDETCEEQDGNENEELTPDDDKEMDDCEETCEEQNGDEIKKDED